ncbi:MAG: PTS sugar transporter subunit IIA, partial [Planctomycetales bacterium]
MRLLRKALVEGSFLLDLNESDITSIFHRVLDFVIARGVLPAERRDEVESALLQREQESSTAIGHALAVPHTYLDAFSEAAIVFVRLSHAINLGAPDGIPTRYLFVLLGPTAAMSQHLDALAGIARLMSDDEFRYDAGRAGTQLDLLAALDQFQIRTAPAPEQEVPEPVESAETKKLFSGWVADIRRRLPYYRSDFIDGLNLKSVASTLFLFFACLAPAITFGGIMA